MDLLQNKVKEKLESKEIAGFLGLRSFGSEPFPFLFTRDTLAELDKLTTGTVRYPLSKILLRIAASHPEETLGIMCRACDERALIELFKNNKLRSDRVITLGIACSDELAQACSCEDPKPSNPVTESSAKKEFDRSDVQKIAAMQHGQRFNFWTEQFGKCIKCYGCRNICPVCFCEVCTLEDQPLVKRGDIPPEIPSFHLTRAFHMAGRCVDCGLCEEACPVDIPLRTLYRRVREVVKELMDYLPGAERDKVPPLQILGDGMFEIKD
jgi:formate dehydrogenase (coenzyme F420) beta subunit